MEHNQKYDNANVALCYIRQSVTRDENDANSPERQRDNIYAFCEGKGWIPEWYQDTGGHKSGRSEKGRPAWLALKKRLGDPDVVALVANDMSRLHRKGWRVGDLIDSLNSYGVALAIAAPGRQQIDTSTQQGRMLVQLGAMFDEYYAEDIAQRARDSVAYRKAKGITIGRPPFGTERDEEGKLIPTKEGVWLLSDGSYMAGVETAPPDDTAFWRGYFEAAERILKLYSEGHMGREKLAYQMNDDGWFFRRRDGEPRPFNLDDIRRITANYLEYGGLVVGTKAKDRPAYEQAPVDEIVFDEDRAVFPIDLLRRVGYVRQQRTQKPSNNGIKRKDYAYPLAGITYCSHCEALAEKHDDPSLNTAFGGTHSRGIFRYRHKRGVTCGVHNRSVRSDMIEADFERLLGLLVVDPEAIEFMTTLSLDSIRRTNDLPTQADLVEKKKETIALCKQRIDAAKFLFLEGDISQAEYLLRKEQNEREMSYWQSFTTEKQKLAMELTMCLEAVQRIQDLWDSTSAEDRQGLVRTLFEKIIYNLDTRRIVDFQLKPWAERFLMLRAKLYEDDNTGEGGDSGMPSGGANDGDVDVSDAASLDVESRMGQLRKQPETSYSGCFAFTVPRPTHPTNTPIR